MDKSVLKNCKVLGEITDIVIRDGIIEKVGKTDLIRLVTTTTIFAISRTFR